MATKGRLTMSGRREYAVQAIRDGERVMGYAAQCTCMLGNHYLAVTRTGAIIELTQGVDNPHPYLFETPAAASEAIEAWQRQHDERRRESAESEA